MKNNKTENNINNNTIETNHLRSISFHSKDLNFSYDICYIPLHVPIENGDEIILDINTRERMHLIVEDIVCKLNRIITLANQIDNK